MEVPHHPETYRRGCLLPAHYAFPFSLEVLLAGFGVTHPSSPSMTLVMGTPESTGALSGGIREIRAVYMCPPYKTSGSRSSRIS